MIKISPSILSADFSKLGDEAKKMETAGADLLHIDVMDGHFVPNITLGAPVVRCLRKVTGVPFDVHLMIDNPEKYIGDFADAGADLITFHSEAAPERLNEVIELIRSKGVKPSISVKPATPVETIFPYLDKLAMVLIMTVEPGFGGQKLIPGTLSKVAAVKNECAKKGLSIDIQVDGGINDQNIADAAKAGANVFVAGSAIFKAPDPAAAMKNLRLLADI